MKNFKIFLLLNFLFFFVNKNYAQTINWANLKSEQKHIVNLDAGGWDYAFVFGVGSLQMRNELCNVPTILAALQ